MTRVFLVGAPGAARDAVASRITGNGLVLEGVSHAWTDARRSSAAVLVSIGVPAAPPGDRDGLAVLVLSDDVERAVREVAVLGFAAWGVLPLGTNAADLRAALPAVAAGFVVVPAGAAPRRAPSDAAQLSDAPRGEALTPREHQVLELASQGLSNREMAALLGISEHTVKFHLASIYAKLGASTRTEAVRRGLRQGILRI